MNENNQMNQFFTEHQNVQPTQQSEPEVSVEQLHPKNIVKQAQEQESEQQPQSQQSQFGSHFGQPMQQYGQQSLYQTNSNTMLPNDKKVLPKVFKIALIGTSIALIGTIISLVLVIFAFSLAIKIKLPYYQGGVLAVLVYAILGVIIGAVFVPLTLTLRKMKSKAPAVVMIVFASIFIVIWLWGLVVFPVVVNTFQHHGVSVPTRNLIMKYPELGTLLQLSYWSLLPGIITIAGWIMLLISGIMGVRVKQSELNANKNNFSNFISEEMYGK